MVAREWSAVAVMAREDTAPVDCLFYIDDRRIVMAEAKCRQMTLDKLAEYKSYLITAEKIKQGIELATRFGTEYWVLVWLLDSNDILGWELYYPNQKIRKYWKVERTKTQKTCNGGEIVRPNAFLPLDYAVHLGRLVP